MSNSTNAILQNAFDLIEENELEGAQNILEPLLETESNNPAVWWVYAHAVQNPEEGMRAIDKVIQLDPTYSGANELKIQMSSMKESASEPGDPIDNWDDLDFAVDDKVSESSSGRSPIRFLTIAIVVVIIVVGIFAILSGALDNNSQQPTQVVDQSTAIPTANIQIVTNISATEMSTGVATDVAPTQEIATNIPTDEPTVVIPTTESTQPPSYLSVLIENLSAYGVSETDIETRQTLLGTTLDVSICAIAGAESSIALNDVMNLLVESNSDAPEDVTAFAVTLMDCNNEQSVPRTIGVERSFVQSFSDEEIAVKDFQREWKPLP
jgi:hypothetical protein